MTDLTLWEQEYKKLEPFNTPKPVADMTDTWRRDVIARKRVELWRMQQQYGAAAAPCQRLGLRINQIVQQDLALPDAWEDNHDAATEQLIAGLPVENPYPEGSVEYRLVELTRGKVATRSEGLKTGGRRRMSSARVVDHIIEDIEYHKLHGTFDGWSAEMLERMENTYGDDHPGPDDTDIPTLTEAAPPAKPYSVPHSLIRTVRGYYEANRHKPNKGISWLRVLIAFGAEHSTAHLPYTAAEARASEKIWPGWAPFRDALEQLEMAQAAKSDDAPSDPDPEVADVKLPKVFRDLKGQSNREHLLDDDRRARIEAETALIHSLPQWTDHEAGEYYKSNGHALPYTPQCANPMTQSVYGQPNGVRGLSKTGKPDDTEIIALLKLTDYEWKNRARHVKDGLCDVEIIEHPEFGWKFAAYKWGRTPGGGVNLGILSDELVAEIQGADSTAEASKEYTSLDDWIEARDNQPLVAPAHKRRFLEWLQVEREMAAKINGAGHPVVKHDVFGKLIEAVKADTTDNVSDLQVTYDNFKSWLDGNFAQEQPDGSMKMGNEEKDKSGSTDWDAELKVKQSQDDTLVWYGIIKQSDIDSDIYHCIGGPSYDDAVLHNAFTTPVGKALSPQQKATGEPVRVSDTKTWAVIYRTKPVKRRVGDIVDELGALEDWVIVQAAGKVYNPMFPYNGVYVTDTRTGCSINYDQVARRRDELTAENVRYRLSRNPKLGAQISWLALEYSGFLCSLPNNKETKTRMVPAEEVRQLIIDGYDVLTPAQYADNQRTLRSRDDKFAAFNLFVQSAPDGRYLGVCPEQSDPTGPWAYDKELFDAIKGDSSQARTVVVPDDIADAIERGDWATVARLAGERA